ncbi:MAG: TraX family protein [Lentilactobacillus diolivorans]|uniref:TraX family protein n=1 Tax=Lentilactobacillus diolivorans TaxID=179838 RepID=UPI0039EACADF
MLVETIRGKGLTNFDIKLLGITLMVIDHIHEMFALAGAPNWLDWFGRPVATIFMFLTVEGFTHTQNQRRYLARLLIGFWVMEIGNLIVQHFFSLGRFELINNIFCDLFLGVLTMFAIQLIVAGKRHHQISKIFIGVSIIVVPFILSGLFVVLMQSGLGREWSFLMLVVPTPLFAENSIFLYLGPVMYLCRKHRSWQMVSIAVAALLSTGFNFSSLLVNNTQWLMILAIIPLAFYNGQLGKSMKGFFYGFYPVHIWSLYILASLLGVRG